MKTFNRLLIIASMIILASSCGRVDLAGEWKIVSVGSEQIQDSKAVPTLSFNEETGQIHGYTGVNIVNGEYVQEGRKLSLKGLGMTMMAGPAEDMALERKIVSAFENIHSTKLNENDELLILDQQGDTLMVLARRSDIE